MFIYLYKPNTNLYAKFVSWFSTLLGIKITAHEKWQEFVFGRIIKLLNSWKVVLVLN
jgi:hypothetical protein